MNTEQTTLQGRTLRFFTIFISALCLIVIVSFHFLDLFYTSAQRRDFIAHAAFWLFLAMIPNLIFYVFGDGQFFSPMPSLNVFSLLCLVNMLYPVVYGSAGNGLYVMTSEMNLRGFFEFTLFLGICLYGLIKLGAFEASDARCHCERKY